MGFRDSIGLNTVNWQVIESILSGLQSANAYMFMKGKDPHYLHDQTMLLEQKFKEALEGFEKMRLYKPLYEEMMRLRAQADVNLYYLVNRDKFLRVKKNGGMDAAFDIFELDDPRDIEYLYHLVTKGR